jgi:predicted dehydrogenase
MTKDIPIRIGILGAALITPKALIEPSQKTPGAELIAIAARDPSRARDFARMHGIAKVHTSYADVINDPDVTVIYNPLPNSLHCEWTIAALRAGKHVLCEKPIASNAVEAERMAKAADESGMFLAEAFHYLYHPLAARVFELMRDGTLGRLLHVEGRFCVPIPPMNIRYDWSLAGGATMDLGCYPLSMIRHFSGLTPRVISARAETGPTNIDVSMETDLDLGDGVTGRMICSMKKDTPIVASFLARGERGELRVTNPVGPHRGHQLTTKTKDLERSETVKGDTSYTHQLGAFAAKLRGEGPFPTDAADAVISMRIIDDVYRASRLPLRGT